jgi:hypothetical protein
MVNKELVELKMHNVQTCHEVIPLLFLISLKNGQNNTWLIGFSTDYVSKHSLDTVGPKHGI